MALSSELISQFVKATKDDVKKPSETTVYGTIVYDGKTYVRLDGAPEDVLTPVSTTTSVENGERVTVLIKDHTATVTGNVTYPSAKAEDVNDVEGQIGNLTDVVIAHKITADDVQAINGTFTNITAITGKYSQLESISAEFESLKAELIEGKTLRVEDIEAVVAKLESIEAKFGGFTEIETEDLEAVNAEITNLKGYTADFTYISAVKIGTKELSASKADIDFANIDDAAITNLTAKFVDVDFANIDQAWFDKLFAKSGIIQNVTISEGVVVKELVGVTIKGDLIEANTLAVDQLVVRGSDGEYYKLSTDFTAMPGVEPVEYESIHGSTIVAHSVTAEKVSVDDLVAFGATIGGFHITYDSLYSRVKTSVDNTTPGVYLDTLGQLAIGDGDNSIKYYADVKYKVKQTADGENVEFDAEFIKSLKNPRRLYSHGDPLYVGGFEVYAGIQADDSEICYIIYDLFEDVRYFEVERILGDFKLHISAESIILGSNGKNTEHVKIAMIQDDDGNEKPCIELAEGDSERKQVITNDGTVLMDGATEKTIINTEGVSGDTIKANRTFEQCGFVWAGRSNGNYGLSWKG